jgi:hypothetical protein
MFEQGRHLLVFRIVARQTLGEGGRYRAGQERIVAIDFLAAPLGMERVRDRAAGPMPSGGLGLGALIAGAWCSPTKTKLLSGGHGDPVRIQPGERRGHVPLGCLILPER